MTTILGTSSYTYIEPNFTALRPCRTEIVGCHNLASARAIAEGRAPSLNTAVNGTISYNAEPFVSPSGQYYVEIHCGSQRVRMDVANVQTARYYAKNGVDTSIAHAAYFASLSK